MKISKSLSCNSLRFITLLVLSSVAFSSVTVNAQTDSKVIDTCTAVPIKVESDKITKAYYDALTDSVKTEPDEIKKNLTIVDKQKSNPNLYLDTQGRVLVVTFTDTKNSHFVNQETQKPQEPPIYDLSNSIDTWVTVAPKLKSFCTCYKKQIENLKTTPEDLNLRIKQLLGIRPEANKTHIVELWVDPDFLKRPSLPADTKNTEILNPDSLDSSKNKGDPFLDWLNKQLQARQDLQKKINLPASELAKDKDKDPWTGLGYTFDWASKLNPSIKESGLSEFVIWGTKDQMSSSGKVPAVEFNRVFTTEEYCKPDNSL